MRVTYSNDATVSTTGSFIYLSKASAAMKVAPDEIKPVLKVLATTPRRIAAASQGLKTPATLR
jgi:hypothetical protein